MDFVERGKEGEDKGSMGEGKGKKEKKDKDEGKTKV
jgi:hypothetical protein